MGFETDRVTAENAERLRAAREADDLRDEREEVRGRFASEVLAKVSRVDTNTEAAWRRDAVFGGPEHVGAWRIARIMPGDLATADAMFTKEPMALSPRIGVPREQLVLVPPGKPAPKGSAFMKDDLLAYRTEAEQGRAMVNARRSRQNWAIVGDAPDPNEGSSPDGVGVRRDPRTGAERYESRPLPTTPEEELAGAIECVAGLLPEWPDHLVQEIQQHIRANSGNPVVLDLRAAIVSDVEGQRPGTRAAWRHIETYAPPGGFPSAGPKERRLTIGQIFEAAKRAWKLQRTYGSTVGQRPLFTEVSADGR